MMDDSNQRTIKITPADKAGFAIWIGFGFQQGYASQLHTCCSTAEEAAGVVLRLLNDSKPKQTGEAA